MDRSTRAFRALLCAYPPAFRDRYRDDLLAFFVQDRAHPRYGIGWRRPWRFWAATLRDLVVSAAAERKRHWRPMRSLRLSLDVRDAVRSLLATPGPTTVALMVLTLGIGMSSAIFAVVDNVALRGLPFDQADRLVSVAETMLPSGRPVTVAAPNYVQWTARQHSFEGLGASDFFVTVLEEGGRSERLLAARVTPNLFGLLRVTPALGRLLSPDDVRPGAEAVVLLSDGAWHRRFGADPGVIGRLIRFESGGRRIVGVMRPGFAYPVGSERISASEFWVPRAFTTAELGRSLGRNYSLSVVGRLKPGATIDQAAREMQQTRDVLAAAYPRWFVDRGIAVRPAIDAVVGATVRSWMLMLLGAVTLVLLIACVNVANVLLARATGRARELGIRAALGATRLDLLRGVLVESFILSAAGATLGLGITALGTAALRATLPADLPRLASVAVDGRVVLVAVLAGLVTGVLFGFVPAIRLSRPNLADTLHASGRASTASAPHQRLRAMLVMFEVSLAIVLLVGAGLFVSSFVRLLDRDLGFDPSHIVTISATVEPPVGVKERTPKTYPDFSDLVARVAAIPGVEHVGGIASGLPLSGNTRSNAFTVSWRPEPFDHDDAAFVHEASHGLLMAMRLQLIRGRWIADTDTPGAPGVVVLSQEAVRRYFGDRDPLGQVVQLEDRSRTVVGIVAGTQFRGPEAQPVPEAWVPLPDARQQSVDLVIRTQADVATLVPAVERAVFDTLPGAVIDAPVTLNALFAEFVAARRFNAFLIAVFGVLALTMVSVGIYGVMACVVDQQTREIGVRMALGARPAEVLRMMLGRATLVSGAGLLAGLAGAIALEQFIRGFLYQPRPYDPAVYLAVLSLTVAVSLIAALMPARRAAGVDPLVALRRD
jgi:putative ABC transport system permease protein